MTAAIPPDPNHGPRAEWRCPARSDHGHQCSQRQHHAGPCRAFKAEWWGIPKGVRRATRRVVRNRATCPLCLAGVPGRHPDDGGSHPLIPQATAS